MSSVSAGSAADPPLDGAYTTWVEGNTARALFIVEGMRCANCSGRVERALKGMNGVLEARVNLATARASASWDPSRASLRSILAAISQAGFKAVPLAGQTATGEKQAERRLALKRLGLAGLGMMQTMMVVYGLYVGTSRGIDPVIATYLKIAGMLFATPVLVYSGKPFFEGAVRSLRQRSLGMDVPVALALTLAFGASVINTLRGTGETYFDSVTMFIFFLLSGRFLELTIRQKRLGASEALARSLPSEVTRVRTDGSRERVSVTSILAGDRLSIPRGAVVPVDATLLSPSALIDEALVTGESMPVGKVHQDRLIGGAVNAGDTIEAVAGGGASESTLAHIVGLLERAQGERPRMVQIADRVAAWFVLATLLLAVAVATVWFFVEPSRAFPAALAVLVVTCPCALSLATPAALAAATAGLARRGLMVTRADALERLAAVDTTILDKTGTLTCGTPSAQVLRTRDDVAAEDALALASALETSSTHPMASAFASHRGLEANEVHEYPGQGVEGVIEGVRWRLGRLEFVTGTPSQGLPPVVSSSVQSNVILGHSGAAIAEFCVRDAVRADAPRAVESLKRLGVDVVLASGDSVEEVDRASRILAVGRAYAALTPEGKMALVQREQRDGRKALVVGDGINDGPVLAAGYVSCAMGEGSAVAMAAADMLLLNEHLGTLADAVCSARQTLRVIRQNLLWAFVYNIAAVPAAAMGWIPPWAAALGMSLSSLGVVLNSARMAQGGAKLRSTLGREPIAEAAT